MHEHHRPLKDYQKIDSAVNRRKSEIDLKIARVTASGLTSASLVTFGISTSTQSKSDLLNSAGKSVLAGLQFFAQTANTWNISIFNKSDRLTFAVKYMEDYGNSTIVRENYQAMINDPEINFLLGPASSHLSDAAKSITEPAGRLLLGTKAGSASFYTGAEFSFSVISSPTRYATTMFPELRIHGIRRIVLVVEQTQLQIDIEKSFVANAEDFSFEIVDQYNTLTDTNGVDSAFIQNVTDTAKLIRSLDHADGADNTFDAIIIVSFTNVAKYFMEAIRDLNYTPKAIFVSSLHVPEFQALDPSLTAFVGGCDMIAPGINFRGEYFGTYEQFKTAFSISFPNLDSENPDNALGAVSGLLLLRSIISADSLDHNEVTRALGRVNEDTFFGPYQFGADHSQLRFLPVLQFWPNPESYQKFILFEAQSFENDVTVIGPSRVGMGDLIYPMPTWDERIFDPQYVTGEYVLMAITAVAQGVSIACIIIVVLFRHHRVIKASSPLFLIYILVGTLLSYSTNYTWTATQFNNASCVLTPIVLGLGFVITFGALFAKSWRIVTLFRAAEKLTVVAISNKKLTIILAVLVGVQTVFSIVLAVYSSLGVEVTDVNRPALWLQRCSDLSANIVLYLNLAYAGVIILTGLVLAVMMRKIKNQLFNEAQHLAFIIYAITVFVVTVTALSFNTLTGVNIYILRSVAILVINLVTVVSLIGTKLNYIRTGKLPVNEDPTAQHRYVPSPRDREEATHHHKISEQIAELKKLAARLRRENELLRNDIGEDNNVRLSHVALLQDPETDDSDRENNSTSSSGSA